MSDYLSLPKAAARLGLTADQLRTAYERGDLPPLRRMGRYFVLDEDDLRRTVEFFGQGVPPAPADVLPGPMSDFAGPSFS